MKEKINKTIKSLKKIGVTQSNKSYTENINKNITIGKLYYIKAIFAVLILALVMPKIIIATVDRVILPKTEFFALTIPALIAIGLLISLISDSLKNIEIEKKAR